MVGFRELAEEMKTAPELYRPSAFWEELGEVGLKQIEAAGLENFKRTVNMTYFNWSVLGILRHQLLPVAGHWIRRPGARVFGARFEDYGIDPERKKTSYTVSDHRIRLPEMASFNALSAWLYKTYIAMLYEFVARHDQIGLLKRLDDPEFGHPFLIEYQGRKISQDLCNSVFEFYSAGGSQMAGAPCNIAELGGGYGRLAYVFLKALPSASYCLIDIPPALNVAQAYLQQVFPDEKLFLFRPFRRYEEIREEFESARIRFLAAHQIEMLPAKSIDLFINISSLHEMTFPQIDNYLRQVDRVCRGRFYSKQWRVSEAKVNGVVMREFDYPIPAAWKRLYHRRHPIQSLFFEALYDCGA